MTRLSCRTALLLVLASFPVILKSNIASADAPRGGPSFTLQWGAGGMPPRNNHWNNHWEHPRPRWDGDCDDLGWPEFRVRFDRELDRGAERGLLSRAELRDLRDHQRQVERLVRDYRSDGFLSRYERRQISDEYAELNSDLEHQLRDGERAGWRDDERYEGHHPRGDFYGGWWH